MDPVRSALDKVEHSDQFTPEETEALKRVAQAWIGLEAFGRLAGVVKAIVVYFGWLIGIYLAIKFFAADWIKGVK